VGHVLRLLCHRWGQKLAWWLHPQKAGRWLHHDKVGDGLLVRVGLGRTQQSVSDVSQQVVPVAFGESPPMVRRLHVHHGHIAVRLHHLGVQRTLPGGALAGFEPVVDGVEDRIQPGDAVLPRHGVPHGVADAEPLAVLARHVRGGTGRQPPHPLGWRELLGGCPFQLHHLNLQFHGTHIQLLLRQASVCSFAILNSAGIDYINICLSPSIYNVNFSPASHSGCMFLLLNAHNI
jgi:hypothetical protein